jgi:hypothetical protein
MELWIRRQEEQHPSRVETFRRSDVLRRFSNLYMNRRGITARVGGSAEIAGRLQV